MTYKIISKNTKKTVAKCKELVLAKAWIISNKRFDDEFIVEEIDNYGNTVRKWEMYEIVSHL